MSILSMIAKAKDGVNDIIFIVISVVFFFLFRKKKKTKEPLVSVWTPQHAPIPDPNHYAFNFENMGWVYNPAKGCYEIWMKQNGYFCETTKEFHPTDGIKGSHRVSFYTRAKFDEWQLNWQNYLL